MSKLTNIPTVNKIANGNWEIKSNIFKEYVFVDEAIGDFNVISPETEISFLYNSSKPAS